MDSTDNELLAAAMRAGAEGASSARKARHEKQQTQLESYLKGQLEKQQQEDSIKQALALKETLEAGGKGKSYGVNVGPRGAAFHENERDPNAGLAAFLSIQDRRAERDRKAIQDIEDRATKAGTAQIIPGMRRLEQVAPGAFTGNAEFKSVGGFKNAIPTSLVSPAESLGLLDKGAAEERAALNEMANLKVYDSSGKQINEHEMKRLQDSMGLRGISDPTVIKQALQQQGFTVLEKQRQVSAGADPRALQEFKKRGGLAGYGSLPEMLNRPSSSAIPSTQSTPSPETPEQEYLRLRMKHKGR